MGFPHCSKHRISSSSLATPKCKVFGVICSKSLHFDSLQWTHSTNYHKLYQLLVSVKSVFQQTLPLVETETRWELKDHPYAEFGIDEMMRIDQCKHSLFGASKVAADVLVQEYERYFGMKTAIFRGASALRNPTAWVSGVSRQMCRVRDVLHRFRLQGEASSRQHPQSRSGHDVLGVLPEPTGGGGLQCRRFSSLEMLDAGGHPNL
jgi:hypothetical protein